MDCREEVTLIERRFKNLPGIEDFSADLMGQRLHVKYDAASVNANAIASAIADAGMRAWLEHEEPVASGESGSRTRLWLMACAAGSFGAGLLAEFLHAPAALVSVLFAGSIAAGVPLTIRKAWQAFRLRSLDINVLMLIAAAGAIALGQWDEAAAVVFLFEIAQTPQVLTIR